MTIRKFNRRTFLKSVGAGALALSLGQLGPYVLGQRQVLIGMANHLQTFFGEAAEKALRLAISQINAGKDLLGKEIPKGILGNPVDLTISDSAGRGDQALRAVQELALSKRADFLTGFFFSEELLGALPAIPVLKKIFLGTGAATPVATIQVSAAYDQYKYFFRVGPFNSFFILQILVLFARDFLEKKHGWNAVVAFAEDAAWTKTITDGLPTLLAAYGSKVAVAKTIRFAEDTADFTGIYKDAVEAMAGKKGGLLTLLAHTGLRPTIQWWDQKVPLPFVGINVQAQDARFPTLSGGKVESVATLTSASRTKITEKTIPFFDAFEKFTAFKPEITIPSYNAVISFDALYILKEAVERAGVLPDTEANTDKIIAELEKTDYIGNAGRIQFYKRGEKGVTPLRPDQDFPHDVRYGPGFVEGVVIQYQAGKQETIFPDKFKTTNKFTAPPWLPG